MIGLGLLVMVLVAVVAGATIAAARRHHPVGLAPPAPGPAHLRRAAAPEAPSALERTLAEWQEHGLLESAQIEPIVAYEAHKHGPRSRIPIAAEAVGYVGAALVLGAVASLIGNHYEELSVPVRVIVLLAPAVLAALAGWFVGRDEDPAAVRLGSVLWVLASALLAGAAVEVFVDVVHDGHAPDHGGLLTVGLVSLAWGSVAYALRRLPLQHLVLFAAAVVTVLGVVDTVEAARDRSVTGSVWALALWGLGALWLAAALADRLAPVDIARLLGAATLLVAAQMVRADETVLGLWLGLGTAAVLLVLGVGRSDVLVLLAAAAGLFQWSPQVAMYYLEPAIGVEATLLVVGLVLLAAAFAFTRLYRRMRAEPPPPTTT